MTFFRLFKKLKLNRWAVYFNGGFYESGKNKRKGREIHINKTFLWGGERVFIPSLYLFKEGIVLDFFVQVSPDSIKAFIDKYKALLNDKAHPEEQEYEQAEAENSLHLSFSTQFTLNGELISDYQSSSMPYIPPQCLFEGLQNDSKAKPILKHYKLDDKKGYSLHRISFPCKIAKKSQIKSLSLKLEQHPVPVFGKSFTNPKTGQDIVFTNPVTQIEHTLTVKEYKNQVLDFDRAFEDEYDYPKNYTLMTYTLSPDFSDKEFSVCDVLKNDEPRLKAQKAYDTPPEVNNAAAIGIIGGADGPTAIFFGNKSDEKYHAGCSALHFEKVSDITWQLKFSKKLREDISVDII